MKTKSDKNKNGDSDTENRPEKLSLTNRPPPPAAIVPKSVDGPRPPGWNGQPRRHGSSRFNVHNHNQELVKLPPIKDSFRLKCVFKTTQYFLVPVVYNTCIQHVKEQKLFERQRKRNRVQ
ncbi:hypothetical protein KGM_214592 [Danaus plexippus plexippus]|uniref:Uncharacterized protein n=1 Tax=Danaus plexippus plexippus TaxID=278856 RepID=A0A212EZR0_DANPL|nr:hypothetical protein KGM_214592 [Danaus plexippus plexippus]